MDIPIKTFKNGFSIPILGLGGWLLGGDVQRHNNHHDDSDTDSVRRAIEAGIRHIDTAEKYADGWSEKIIGTAIKKYERSSLFLATKVSKEHLSYDGVIAAARGSLQRLDTAYIDLYYIHAPNPDIPISETMRALNDLRSEGLIRNIGVSNFTVKRFEEAQQCSAAPIVANQVNYNLRFREVESRGILTYCQAHDICLVAWRPIKLKMQPGTPNHILDEMCKTYSKSQAQISLNWLMTQKNVVVISGMKEEAHLQDNLGAIGWGIERHDVERLRNEFPDQQQVSDVVGALI